VGTDYYIWALQISGLGSLLSGINFFVTILKMRCPGMTLMKMPLFTWTTLCSSILIIGAFPVLTVDLALLALDRYMDMHFFTTGFGGDQMIYVNLIWMWGHPEVYILVLPAFGIFSEIVATFSKKPLFGYTLMVWATAVIAILSFLVWLHHFFTMGAGGDVNAVFGIATMIISIPTGVKLFNWIFTMYRGRITFASPMYWMMGFFVTFTIGGMTGVMLAVPGIDFQVHNSAFLVAHFHNVIIGGVVFGYFAGITYWFPKMFGFTLNERLGKYAFWCWMIGFFVAFMPLYILGPMGMTRRLYHYDASTGFHPYLVVAAIGAAIIALGVLFQVLQIIVSIKNKEKYRDLTGDPWDGRTLEWATSSPPPFYNFARDPSVEHLDAYWETKHMDVFWEHKKRGLDVDEKPLIRTEPYHDIHMPKNTAVGFIMSGFALVFGFAMVWHIWWLAIVGLVCMVGSLIFRACDYDIDYYVKASTVEEIETKHQQEMAGAKL
jgi:cytochrome o ubiquinol oxidase subunit 1